MWANRIDIFAEEPISGARNVALGGIAWQISTYGGYNASRAIDGNNGSNLATCSHTSIEDKPFWALDLETWVHVAYLKFTNRNARPGNV